MQQFADGALGAFSWRNHPERMQRLLDAFTADFRAT
jgi:hypothetical protein